VLKVGVLASGRGSNLEALIRASRAGERLFEIVCVISDVATARALNVGRGAGIPTYAVDPGQFGKKRDYEARIVEILKTHEVSLVALAGYMRIVGPELLSAFPGRIMNIHPSLLPAFPGLEAQAQALAYGVKVTGCTVHFVDGGMDTGPIIVQKAVVVEEDDTVSTLSARILEQEHIAYPEAIAMYAKGRLSLSGRRVIVKRSETNA